MMGSQKNDGTQRQRIRKKLVNWGMDKNEIDKCIEQIAQRQRDKRRGKLPIDAPLCTRAEYARFLRLNKPINDHSAAILHLGEDYQAPSDAGYKPTKVDSVLTGVARATGVTAKVIKKRKTVTKYQYDNEYNT